MARHSASESSVRVAGWVWAALVAVVLVIALVVGWFVLARNSSDDQAAGSCVEGDAELTVWADPAADEIARGLVEDYNATNPVVRDECVTAVVELKSTAEATTAYRAGEPGVAPVWIPAGTGFIPGLSGAPTEVPVVGSDALVHRVPEGADADPANAVLPSGAESMVSALATEAAGVDVDTDALGENPGPSLQEALTSNLPILTSTSLSAGDGTQVGEVEFPLVAFGSSPAVDENSARAAADFASSTQSSGTVSPEPASPWLTRVAGTLAEVALE